MKHVFDWLYGSPYNLPKINTTSGIKINYFSRLVLAGFILGCAALSGGCASITGTPGQSVSVQTHAKAGEEVTGAACELNNKKGKWFVTTPGTVAIIRSNDAMQVLCQKGSQEPGKAAVVSATKDSMYGNILFGGGIGAIIDHNTGAAYEYPALIQVVMGDSITVLPPDLAAKQSEGAEPEPAFSGGR